MTSNIFVVGLEPFNATLLDGIGRPGEFRFVELLGYHEAARPLSEAISFKALLTTAEERMAAFEGDVSGIIGYFDFPTSSLVPVLCHRRGLPAPTLEAVASCEHKHWSRLLQNEVVPELVPRYRIVDPFRVKSDADIGLDFPYWIKPIKAHSSYLGFRINSDPDLQAALPVIRHGISTLGDAFNEFLELVSRPPEIARISGLHCIVEEIISTGRQCTLEGYSWGGEVVVYGMVDSVRTGRHRSSFFRYQFPSSLPRRATERMVAAAGTVIRQCGYDMGAFNIEFYWNPGDDQIRLLEVNARISKSHSPLFKLVDGATHQQVLVDLALGRQPEMPHRRGRYRLAAKFMIRRTGDGLVRRIPDGRDLQRVERAYPDTVVRILVAEGQRLANLSFQDSYSYELAELFLGGDSQADLLRRYRHCLELLPFEIDPPMPFAA